MGSLALNRTVRRPPLFYFVPLLSPLSSPRGGWSALLLLVLPLASSAQTVPSGAINGPAVPHAFVGLGAGYLAYEMPGAYTVRLPSLVPTVGVVFSPRWSLQVSGDYQARTEAGGYTVTRFGPTGPGTNVTYGSTVSQRTWAVPILARYALCAPTHRWQFDVLGGVTLVHDAFRRAATTDSADVHVGATTSTQRLGVNLTLGLGARYALTPRLSFTGDAMLTRVLNGSAAPARFATPSLVVGLRYALGRRD